MSDRNPAARGCQPSGVDILSFRSAPLQPDSCAQRVAAAVREDIEHLVVEAAVRAQRFIRDVQRLEDTR